MAVYLLLKHTALAALEAVILRIPPAQSGGKLEVPARSDDPLVSVGDASSHSPSAVAGIGKACTLRSVGVEGEEYLGHGNGADVELGVVGAEADEMAVKALAEPVSHLG